MPDIEYREENALRDKNCMTQNLDKDFVTIRRKGILRGDEHHGHRYTRPFVENKGKTKVKVEDRKIDVSVDADNLDIFYAAREAGYNRKEEFDYEIRIKKKE